MYGEAEKSYKNIPALSFVDFKQIKEYYDTRDREGLKRGKLPMHTTEWGFWGTTNMNDAHLFFTRIKLQRFSKFIDLGCGDGRVVHVASLFTNATGIEGDEELANVGREAAVTLGGDGTVKHGDYYEENFSQYDIIFMFPDRKYDALMVGKLLSEFKGYLFVYNRVYAPPGIKPGKTYWIDQMPIASYPIGIEEENLERHRME